MMEPRTVLLDDEDERRRRRRLGRLKRARVRVFLGSGDPFAASAEDYVVSDEGRAPVLDDDVGGPVITDGA